MSGPGNPDACPRHLNIEQNRHRLAEAVISDDAIEGLERIARNVRIAFAHATFDGKRTLLEMLDVRAMVKAIEGGKSYLEFSCVLTDKGLFMLEKSQVVTSDALAICPTPSYNVSTALLIGS
jgi:hypothetical protein